MNRPSFKETKARLFDLRRAIINLRLLLFGLCGPLVGGAILLSQAPYQTGNLALVGATVYLSPTEAPLVDGVVLIEGGKIAAVGGKRQTKVPKGGMVFDCTGLTLTAGFWNSHVHFTEPKWEKAGALSSSQLSQQLRQMFTRYGFTTVFDTGSDIENTKTIRRRIETGEVDGPRILSTGPGLVPKNGTPYYVKPFQLPEVESPSQAAALVEEKLKAGADAIKIFSAPTPIQGKAVLLMPVELIEAITAEAHRHSRVVFAHPENDAGVNAAVDGGVDILAHTAPSGTPWTESQAIKLKRSAVTLIPTLSLWKKLGEVQGASQNEIEDFLKIPLNQVRVYSKAGGQILFGTDVGFITDYDPMDEYQLMSRAGMSFREILASLTTAPSDRFSTSTQTGRIAPGMDADIVLLNGDPAADIAAFSKVKYTLRGGRIIFQSAQARILQPAACIRTTFAPIASSQRTQVSFVSRWGVGRSESARSGGEDNSNYQQLKRGSTLQARPPNSAASLAKCCATFA